MKTVKMKKTIQKNKQLIKMFGFTLMLIAVTILGKTIPLPGVSAVQGPRLTNSALLHFLSVTTGGNLVTPTMFSLGLAPYMSAMIFWQTIRLIDADFLNNLTVKAQGHILHVMTLIVSLLQALLLTLSADTFIGKIGIEHFSKPVMQVFIVIFLTTGGMIFAWFAEMNTQKGIGQQMVLFLPGIIQGMIAVVLTGYQNFYTAQKVNPLFVLGMLALTAVFIYITLFMFTAERRIHYKQVGIESKFNKSYFPIRLLNAGVMPIMLTGAVYRIPSFLPFENNSMFRKIIKLLFTLTSLPGTLMYGLIFFLLCMAFTYINIRPYDIAKNLRESGDYIVDFMPGRATQNYITKVMNRVSLVGNLYLLLMTVVPLWIGLQIVWVQNLSFYFGSVFFMIVIIDNVRRSVNFVRNLNKDSIFE